MPESVVIAIAIILFLSGLVVALAWSLDRKAERRRELLGLSRTIHRERR
jgi:hypothetical protein